MSDVLKMTDERIAALEEEIKKLRDFRTLYTMIVPTLGTPITDMARVREKIAPSILGGASALEESSQSRPRATGNPKPRQVLEAAKEVIIEAGRPLIRREIYEALKDRGMEVQGVDPLKVIGTTLWRFRDEIESLDSGGYWPVGVPLPKADLDDLLG